MGDLNVYVDGLPEAEKPEVRDHFSEGKRLQGAESHREAIQEFLKAFAASENGHQRSALHLLIGNSFLRLSELREAEGYYHQAISAAAEVGDVHGQAAALGNLGLVYEISGDLDAAEEHHKRALALHEEIGDKLGQAETLGNLGNVYIQRGDLDAAQDHVAKALDINKEIGDRDGQAS